MLTLLLLLVACIDDSRSFLRCRRIAQKDAVTHLLPADALLHRLRFAVRSSREIATLAGKREVQLLSPRGVGKNAWTRRSPPNYVERAHALLGRTVDQGRVWDAVAAVRWLQIARTCKSWEVAGRGRAGVLAAYAALFEPSIAGVIAVDPPASHRDGPYFLGIQRVLDVPEALGLLAPLPLTLVNAGDKAFERTARIYKLAGAADRLPVAA